MPSLDARLLALENTIIDTSKPPPMEFVIPASGHPYLGYPDLEERAREAKLTPAQFDDAGGYRWRDGVVELFDTERKGNHGVNFEQA